MARVYYRSYSAFQRNILAEFMSKKELSDLDKRYNEAKVDREIKRLQKKRRSF